MDADEDKVDPFDLAAVVGGMSAFSAFPPPGCLEP